MNAWQLAEDIRVGIEGTSTGVDYRHAQDEQKLEAPAYPAVIVGLECEPFSADGKVGKFRLVLHVKSQAQNTTGAAHAALVAETRAQFLPDTSPIISYIDSVGHFHIVGYNAGPDDPNIENNAFSTPIVIVGTVREL